MTTILLPYIDFSRHFPAIVALYDAKAADYNGKVAIARDSGDRSSNFLKSAHRELYFDWIRAIKGEMARSMLIFKDTPSLLARIAGSPVVLMTNRKRLAARTKKSEATIYRLTERLIDAGIIADKINHGTQHDYELHLNHEMVPISDYKNEGYDPLRETLKNSIDTTIQETLRSFCTPSSSNKNILNNKIITGNIQEQDKVSAALINNNEQSRTFYKNTGDPDPASVPSPALNTTEINTFDILKTVASALSATNKTKINTSVDYGAPYGQKIKDLNKQFEERSRRYSLLLVEFVISVLFSTRNIYQQEREKAYRYAEYYFKDCNTSIDCERQMVFYRDRVRIVQRFLERHKEFDWSNIYPAHYMDPENYESGFIKTGKWLKNQQKFKDLQFKTRKLKTEEAIVTYALARLMKYKNKSAYNHWRSYVVNKAPSKLMEYENSALAVINSLSVN